MSRCSAQAALGRQLAELHLHNTGRGAGQGAGQRVEKFGFQVDTCCGFLPQTNTWAADWVQFYTNKVKRPSLGTYFLVHFQLEGQIRLQNTDEECQRLWSQLKPRVSALFQQVVVSPALYCSLLYCTVLYRWL